MRLLRHARKCSEKLTPPTNMKNTAMPSITSLSKKPKFASCVELPPVETVEKLCAIASNVVMPASL